MPAGETVACGLQGAIPEYGALARTSRFEHKQKQPLEPLAIATMS